MKKYQMIRSKAQEARCLNGGSALYCKCGCQTPHDSDPEINLTGVTVSCKSDHGYADFILSRNGVKCGSYNTQYNAIFLDGVEFLGVDKDFTRDLFNQAISIPETIKKDFPAGGSLTETATREALTEEFNLQDQDDRNRKHPGYCKKCHSYCYGDCEAN